MIVNINDEKKPWLKNVLCLTPFQNNLIVFGFHQSKYSQTSTAPVDPLHLKVEVRAKFS